MTFEAHAADARAEHGRAPGDQHAGRDGDEARRDAARIAHAAEPGHQDDGEQTRPICGVMYISIAGRMEMKATDTPASVPSSAARGVIFRM